MPETQETKTAVFHQQIIDKLEYLSIKAEEIEKNGKEANHRTTKLEERMVKAETNLAVAFKRLTGQDTIALKYKSDSEKAQKDLIKSQQEDIDGYKSANTIFYKKVGVGVIMAVIYILTITGVIDAEFVKSLF